MPLDKEQQPQKLDYATRVGEYPKLQAHPLFATFLIGITALVTIWTIFFGVSMLPDLWQFGCLLIGSGICLLWATLGKLAGKGMQLGAALFLLIVAIAIDIPTILISHQLDVRQQLFSPDTEYEVSTYKLICEHAIGMMTLATACAVYTAARLLSRRGKEFN